MNSLSTNSLKEIAEQLDCGFRSFVHTTTGQFLFVPDHNNYPDMDLNLWDEEFKKLEKNFTDYFEIEKWTSGEAFEMMAEFTEQLADNKQLQSKLINALKKKKPFREFKFVIDNSGDFRQQWFDFKSKWQQDFVENQLNRLK